MFAPCDNSRSFDLNERKPEALSLNIHSFVLHLDRARASVTLF